MDAGTVSMGGIASVAAAGGPEGFLLIMTKRLFPQLSNGVEVLLSL